MGYFKGKTAIITGAGSGIGRALAMEMANAGARLALTDIKLERIEELRKELEKTGTEVQGYQVDHSDWAQVKEFSEKFFKEWAKVDVLCLNAGVGIGGRIEQTKIKDWKWAIDNNLWSVIYMLNLFLPEMISRKEGQILITASGGGLIGIPGMTLYCTTKFALVGMGEALRAELSKYNIKLSVLCPGIINTRIIQDGEIFSGDEQGEEIKSKVRDFYQRFGAEPKKVAREALRGLRWNQGIIPSPWVHSLLWILKRICPSFYQYLAGLIWRKEWLV